MIKYNSRRFKRKNFLSRLPHARDYEYQFKDEDDDEVKIVKITADEWFHAVNLMHYYPHAYITKLAAALER